MINTKNCLKAGLVLVLVLTAGLVSSGLASAKNPTFLSNGMIITCTGTEGDGYPLRSVDDPGIHVKVIDDQDQSIDVDAIIIEIIVDGEVVRTEVILL